MVVLLTHVLRYLWVDFNMPSNDFIDFISAFNISYHFIPIVFIFIPEIKTY